MSDVIAIAELPEVEMLDALEGKPLEFFRALKHLPDAPAGRLQKELARRWTRLEARVHELEALVKAVHWEERSVEEDRYEIVSELVDKAMQGFEILDEHAERRVPGGHRLVLESRLLAAVGRAFDRAEAVLRDFHGKDRDFAADERADLRLEIRLLDATYTEMHTAFLQSYLDVEWDW